VVSKLPKKKQDESNLVQNELELSVEEPQVPDDNQNETPTDRTDVPPDEEELLLFGKKKKKKKKVDILEIDDSIENVGKPSRVEVQNKEGNEENGEGDVADNEFGKKKPKRKKEPVPIEDWQNSDRDYDYSYLLNRVFTLLSDNNPDLVKSKKKQVIIKPPEVLREGTKKTVWANYQEICDMMHRQSDHVLAYARAELGTTASIDGNQRLVIKGRFQPKQIESVVRHYVAEYVSCRTCKSPDTDLKKRKSDLFYEM